MGFLDAKFATNALLSVKGAITAKSYNKAVRALKNQKTDMLCKPFYVGRPPVPHPEQREHHRRLQERQRRRAERLHEFQAVDQAIAQTRAWEKKFKLNTGK